MHVTIIGLGLIGGSVARDLRRTGFSKRITGVDTNSAHAQQAVALGLVDVMAPLATAVRDADLTILAIPVDAIVNLLPTVLDAIESTHTVVDLGSTKQSVVNCVQSHPQRLRFVAAHPMAGTENSGPAASVAGLFHDKTAILCDINASAPDAVRTVEAFFTYGLEMRLVRMNAANHDLQAAYVSHLSHVVSYALALSALTKEQDGIFTMAGGGFASTARLACSSANTWEPIFSQNRTPVLEAIDTFQMQLDKLRTAIATADTARIHALISAANRIRDILPR